MATLRRLDERVQPHAGSTCRSASAGAVVGGRQLHAAAAATACEASSGHRALALAKERDRREAAAVSKVSAAAEALYAERQSREQQRQLQDNLAVVLEAENRRCALERAQLNKVGELDPDLKALRRRCEHVRATQRQAVQLLEQEVREEEAICRTNQMADQDQLQRMKEAEAAMQQELSRRASGAEYREELRAQALTAAKRAAEETRMQREQERRLADDAHTRAREEDERSFARRKQVQADMRGSMQHQLDEREAEARNRSRQEAEAVQATRAYLASRDQRVQRFADARRRADQQREVHLQRLRQDLLERTRLNHEFEALRDVLLHEEREAELQRQDAERLERQYEARLAAAQACQDGLRRVEARRRAAVEEEERWRDTFLARLADEDRLEQLSDQRRRQRQAEHRRQSDQHLVDKRRQRQQELANQQLELEQQAQEEARRTATIEEEIQRLLEKYAQLHVALPPSCGSIAAPSRGRPHSAGALRRPCDERRLLPWAISAA